MVKRSRSIDGDEMGLSGPLAPLSYPTSTSSTTTTRNIRSRLPSFNDDRHHNDDEEVGQQEESAPAVADEEEKHRKEEKEDVPVIHGVKASSTITEENEDEARNSRAIPDGFVCPLTLEVMVDPVLDGEGNTYERKALLEWLKKCHQSPISRQPLNQKFLVPNIALRDAINDFMGEACVKKRTAELDQEYPSCEETGSYKDDATSTSIHYTKERLKIDTYLSEIGRQLGKDLHLNDQGICAFTCDGARIVVEVPLSVGPFVMYSTDFMLFLTNEVKDYLLALNYLQCETRKFSEAREKYACAVLFSRFNNSDYECLLFLRYVSGGGSLSVRKLELGSEILFSYVDRVQEISSRDFRNIIENFVETAISLRRKIRSVVEGHLAIMAPQQQH
jgi:hypothetical protein